MILVLGGSESGTGAAVLARKKGYSVFVSDAGPIPEKYKSVLSHLEIPFEEGKHSLNSWPDIELAVKSPGIPDSVPSVKCLKEKGIPVVSEIEWAYRFSNGSFICITGSNGKTTTTLLIHHILKNAGLDVGLGGNVGKSFAAALAEQDHDFWVLEISSFQLDGMFDFKADIGILTNITPDHLDRYDNDFEKYAASKLRIGRNQSEDDFLIWNHDDAQSRKMITELKTDAIKLPFTIKDEFQEGAWIENKELKIIYKGEKLNMTLESLALQGKHNIYNSMAAAVTARILDIRKDSIKESLSDFQNVEHRLEYVTTVHGIKFINDSKATNVNSTWFALESMTSPTIWIVGGVDKGNDYSSLLDMVDEKVKAIICLGSGIDKVRKDFGKCVKTIDQAGSAMEAVQKAYNLGNPGDVVLLSPACASFDLFENYEDRGRQFKIAIREL